MAVYLQWVAGQHASEPAALTWGIVIGLCCWLLCVTVDKP